MRRSMWLAAVVLCAAPSFAAPQGVVTLERSADKNATAAFWTPERLAAAKPIELAPTVTADAANLVAEDVEGFVGEGVSEPGSPPSRRPVKSLRQQILDPSAVESFVDEAADAIEGENVGTQGAHFTSSRLIPLTADQTYPYSTVGRLFFTQPGVSGTFVCTASVIKQRLILTAGHCVHKGSGGNAGFFTNFLFVPAYRDGSAPFGTWDWQYVVTTTTWTTGNAHFPNAQDFAVIELVDHSGLRIGASYTGWLGYATQKLNPNHATILGYPVNLDNGEKIHQVTAGSKGAFNPDGGNSNTVIYGSDMRGGASGGPWIQNFGAVATGQTQGTNKGLNQVIGVTSYGPVALTPLFLGSSIPDSRFVSILNTACAHRAGNCS